jgi:hypothetical protein
MTNFLTEFEKCRAEGLCFCEIEGHSCCIYCDRKTWCDKVCPSVKKFVELPKKVGQALEPSYELILDKILRGEFHDEYNNLFAIGRFLINKLHTKMLEEGV